MHKKVAINDSKHEKLFMTIQKEHIKGACKKNTHKLKFQVFENFVSLIQYERSGRSQHSHCRCTREAVLRTRLLTRYLLEIGTLTEYL